MRLGARGVLRLPAQAVLVAGGGRISSLCRWRGQESGRCLQGRRAPGHARPLQSTDAPGSASLGATWRASPLYFTCPRATPAEGVNALSLSLLTVCEANTHCPHFAEEEMGSEVTWLVSGH